MKYQLVLHVNWGTEINEIVPLLTAFPKASMIKPGQVQNNYAPLAFRLDHKNGLHLLSRSGADQATFYIHRFTSGGVFESRVEIPGDTKVTAKHHIVDFIVDQALNFYLLETIKEDAATFNRLRKFTQNGALIWEKKGLNSPRQFEFNSFEGQYARIFVTQSDVLYLIPAEKSNTVVKLDPTSGDLLTTIKLNTAVDQKLFISKQDAFLRSLFINEKNTYGTGLLLPGAEKESIYAGDDTTYGLLQFPYGIDADLNIYTCRMGSSGHIPGFAKLSHKCRLIYEQSLQFVVANKRFVYTGHYNQGAYDITAYKQGVPADAASFTLSLPEGASNDICNLINVDEEDRFYFCRVGKKPGHKTLFIVSKTGAIEEETEIALQELVRYEQTLQAFTYWQADAEGNTYFPLLGPDGFRVIRFGA